MRTRPLAILAVTVALLAAPSAAQAALEDSVVAKGTTSKLTRQFDITATSTPRGGTPSGRASFDQGGGEFPGPFHFEGSVSCLAVKGNRAVIGVDIDVERSDVDFQGYFITVVDGGRAGSGLDTIHAAPSRYSTGRDFPPTDCSLSTFEDPIFGPDPVTSGDIEVTDSYPRPITKRQCKLGGWATLGFPSRRICDAFVRWQCRGGRYVNYGYPSELVCRIVINRL
jgi:hypothetical protein